MKPNLLLDAGLGPLLRKHPITCIDVGSRGGFEPDLLPIAGAVDGVGFEPEPAAFAELVARPAGPWHSLRHLPIAIAGSEGTRTLHVPEDPEGASLLPHDQTFACSFDKQQFFRLVKTVSVQTRVLDAVLAQAGIDKPAYLKLDVEGAELEILKGAPNAIAHLLAIKAEVSFVPFRIDQPLAGEVEAFLRGKGFVLMDLYRTHRWRVNGYVIHPYSAAQRIPYSRGQMVQGDFLFFRAPETIIGADRRFQAAALAMAHGYFDHAERLMDATTTDWLNQTFGCDGRRLLDECSRVYGRSVWKMEVWGHFRRFLTFARSLMALWSGR